MSTTRLMILGLVTWLQPVHGYDIRRELVGWNVESWANIQPGSIYHALRKLSEEGLLEAVATEQVGARPARTTYRMTPAGDREFQALLRKYWWEYVPPVDPFLSALALLPALPRGEAVGALRARARVLEMWIREYRENDMREWLADKPPHVGWQFELVQVKAEAEARWCHDVAARIEAGEGVHDGERVESAFSTERWRESVRREFGEQTGDDAG